MGRKVTNPLTSSVMRDTDSNTCALFPTGENGNMRPSIPLLYLPATLVSKNVPTLGLHLPPFFGHCWDLATKGILLERILFTDIC